MLLCFLVHESFEVASAQNRVGWLIHRKVRDTSAIGLAQASRLRAATIRACPFTLELAGAFWRYRASIAQDRGEQLMVFSLIRSDCLNLDHWPVDGGRESLHPLLHLLRFQLRDSLLLIHAPEGQRGWRLRGPLLLFLHLFYELGHVLVPPALMLWLFRSRWGDATRTAARVCRRFILLLLQRLLPE